MGLVLDAMTAGATLGVMTAAGATVGGLIGAGRAQGRRLINRAKGMTELRCDVNTLRLLALRQIMLVEALLRRGHAAVTPVSSPPSNRLTAAQRRSSGRLPAALEQAKLRPSWSRLDGAVDAPDPARASAQSALADVIADILHRPPDAPLEFP